MRRIVAHAATFGDDNIEFATAAAAAAAAQAAPAKGGGGGGGRGGSSASSSAAAAAASSSTSSASLPLPGATLLQFSDFLVRLRRHNNGDGSNGGGTGGGGSNNGDGDAKNSKDYSSAHNAALLDALREAAALDVDGDGMVSEEDVLALVRHAHVLVAGVCVRACV